MRLAGQHPRNLDDPLIAIDVRDARADDIAVMFCHHDVVVGMGGDLGKMGDGQHLMPIGEAGKGSSDRTGCCTANSGIHLVEHQRRRTSRQHQPQSEHHSCQFTTGSDLGEGQGGARFVGIDSELDIVGRPVSVDCHLETCSIHRQLAKVGVHGGREIGGGSSALFGDHLLVEL